MIRILIADDHPIVRSGVKAVLEFLLADTYSGEAINGLHAMKMVQEQEWNLLILDLSMPGMSGFEILRLLRVTHPNLPILVFSIHEEREYGRRVLMEGSRGYLSKLSCPDEFASAVRKVLAGGRYVSEELAESLASAIIEPLREESHDALSRREFEILQMIGKGTSVGDIATQLHLAVTTVSTYRKRILEKMHKDNTTEIIRYVLEHHLDS